MNIKTRLSKLESEVTPLQTSRPWKRFTSHPEEPEDQVQETIARMQAEGFNVIHRQIVAPRAYPA